MRNNRGINDKSDLPLAYLESLYDEIRSRQIQVDIGVSDATQSAVDYTDAATWNKLIRQSAADQAPAVFTPTVAARQSMSSDGDFYGDGSCESFGGGALATGGLHDRDMFLAMARPLLETMVALWDGTADDHVLSRVFHGLWDYALVCLNLNLHGMLSR